METQTWTQATQPERVVGGAAQKGLHPPAQPRPCSTRAGRAVGQELPWEDSHMRSVGSLSTCPGGSHTYPLLPRTFGCLSGSHCAHTGG